MTEGISREIAIKSLERTEEAIRIAGFVIGGMLGVMCVCLVVYLILEERSMR